MTKTNNYCDNCDVEFSVVVLPKDDGDESDAFTTIPEFCPFCSEQLVDVVEDFDMPEEDDEL